MKTYFILFVLFFFSSCSWHRWQENLAQKEITRFQNDFIWHSFAAGIPIKDRVKVNFVEIKEKFKESKSWGGVCSKGEIFIDQNWWVHSSVLQKEQLVFHELGHCAVGLGHAKGIMGEKEIPTSFYSKNREILIVQMFNQAKRKKTK